jgi:hypothetical protein
VSLPLFDDDFFASAPDLEEAEEPFDLIPRDPVLARKMGRDVQLRRARFTRVVAGVVACAALLLLAALAHHRWTTGVPDASAARAAPETAVHAGATLAPAAASTL